MNRIALGLEYEGSAYHGWQRQQSLATIQQALETALSSIVCHPVEVIASGRTDAGVHALGQVVHFDTNVQRPLDAFVRGGNTHLPKTIRILWAKQVDDQFHARYSAIKRRYIYLLYPHKVSPGFMREGVTWVHYPLDANAMNQAGQYLLGEHDFSSFRAADCQSNTPFRHLEKLTIRQVNDLVVVDITANAFLHHMVRNIVGTLLRIGKGDEPPLYAKQILEKRDRRLAPQMAPAQGLYLLHVTYPETIELENKLNMPWFLSPELSACI